MKHRTSVLNIAILVLVFAVAGAAQSTEIDSRDLLAEAEQVLRDQKMFELFNNCRAVPDKASDNVTVQRFRKDCLRELKKIKMAWPGLNYTTAPGVLILAIPRPRPSRAVIRPAAPRGIDPRVLPWRRAR